MGEPSQITTQAKTVQKAVQMATPPATPPAIPPAIPPILQAPTLNYRANLIQRANSQIPLTTEGLPVGLYRADLLPNTKPESPQEEIQAVRNSYVDLSYEHGYPTLPDGRPFWHKLDFEPGFAYGAFQIYLDSLDGGPRELHSLSKNLELRTLATKVYCSPQEIEALPENDKLIPEAKLHKVIYEFSVLYCWRWRTKAHDLYKDAAYRHLRLRRQMTVEDRHFGVSERYLKELQEKVFDAPDFWNNMSAKTAVDLFAKLVAIQRISIGLPAAGPLSQKETPEDMTFEMIMRSMGSKQHQGNTYDQNGGGGQQGRKILEHILQDPNAAAGMQELIVRVTRSTQAALPNPEVSTQALAFKGRGRSNQIITEDDFTAGLDITGAPGENLDIDSIELEPIPEKK